MKYLWTEDIGAGLHFWRLMIKIYIESSPIEASSLSAAFRESELSAEDMEVISSINRIALNSEYMAELLKDGSFS